MDLLAPYIPPDRLRALARGETLPDRTAGAVLFADISGFTSLTEALARTLGPHQGAEELSRQLNRVYDALIAEVERYGGSVISFSGDAVTCWFDGDDGARAASCALALHIAMARCAEVALPAGGQAVLALKAAVACGPVRRLVVGDPQIQRFDVLAGATLLRMAAAEQLAHRAETVLSPECTAALERRALVLEWRTAPDEAGAPARYPVLGGLLDPAAPAPWPPLEPGALREEELRPWLLPAVYRHLRAGQSVLLTELRPAVALFLRFDGLDYDADPQAEQRLDGFVRWVQQTLGRYEGALLQIHTDDKGSHLYAVFGAPTAHEDDARRAVSAALALRELPGDLAERSGLRVTGIGISQGTLRAGAYGAATRRTYGVLGEEVNLAARLMQHVGPGEVLASEAVRQATQASFTWELQPPMLIKGRRAPVVAARLLGALEAAPEGPAFQGALVGRAAELAYAARALAPILEGRFAGVLAVYGEAGIGKSRLVAALRRRLSEAAPAGLAWAACPSDPLARQSLAPLRAGLRGLCGLDPDLSGEAQQARFTAHLDDLVAVCADAPDLAVALERGRPVLAALLGLPSARPGQTLAQTGAALAALLRAETQRRPLVICLEDMIWLDEDSRALVQGLLPALQGLPLALLLTSRYRDDGRAPALDTDLPQQTLHLGALAPQESRALAEQTLGARLDERLAALLAGRSGGNPLFVEQLALDMRERGALAVGPDGLATLQLQAETPETALPASLSAALVARLDRLAPPVRAAVQSAAVLGVEFEERVLELVLLEEDQPGAAVRRAAREGVWDAQGGGRFRFRHALLRDAAYSMQLGERLRELHARACAAIEQLYGDDLAGQVAALAYHARAAADDTRERRYLTLLGEQAFNISAFRAALACFERALALAPPDNPGPRAELLAWQARAHLRLDAPEQARLRYEESLALAEAACDDIACAEAACELGDLAIRHGDYAAALTYLERAEERYRAAGHLGGQSRALNLIGAAHIALGDTERALAAYDRALKLSR